VNSHLRSTIVYAPYFGCIFYNSFLDTAQIIKQVGDLTLFRRTQLIADRWLEIIIGLPFERPSSFKISRDLKTFYVFTKTRTHKTKILWPVLFYTIIMRGVVMSQKFFFNNFLSLPPFHHHRHHSSSARMWNNFYFYVIGKNF
jgi:hypothetical protein